MGKWLNFSESSRALQVIVIIRDAGQFQVQQLKRCLDTNVWTKTWKMKSRWDKLACMYVFLYNTVTVLVLFSPCVTPLVLNSLSVFFLLCASGLTFSHNTTLNHALCQYLYVVRDWPPELLYLVIIININGAERSRITAEEKFWGWFTWWTIIMANSLQ